MPNPVNPVIVGLVNVFVCPNAPNAVVGLPKPPNAGAAEETAVPNAGAPNPVAGFCPAIIFKDLNSTVCCRESVYRLHSIYQIVRQLQY